MRRMSQAKAEAKLASTPTTPMIVVRVSTDTYTPPFWLGRTPNSIDFPWCHDRVPRVPQCCGEHPAHSSVEEWLGATRSADLLHHERGVCRDEHPSPIPP